MNIFLWAIVIVVAVIVFWLIVVYNGVIKFKLRTDEAWSDIDVQLKRRYDLIPNLVETVKGYAQHERQLFEKVTEARAKAISAQGPEQKAEAENMLSGTLKSLFAVAEAYPDLKANQNFLQFQNQFKEIEDSIEAARRYYNAVVRDFNILIESFPSNIVASMFNFKQAEFFRLEEPEETRKPIRPDFSS